MSSVKGKIFRITGEIKIDTWNVLDDMGSNVNIDVSDN